MTETISIERCKSLAIKMRKRFVEFGADVQLMKCQQAIAAGFGFRTWEAMAVAGRTDGDFYLFDAADRLFKICDGAVSVLAARSVIDGVMEEVSR